MFLCHPFRIDQQFFIVFSSFFLLLSFALAQVSVKFEKEGVTNSNTKGVTDFNKLQETEFESPIVDFDTKAYKRRLGNNVFKPIAATTTTSTPTTTTTSTLPEYIRRGGGLWYGKIDENGRIVETKARTTTTTTTSTLPEYIRRGGGLWYGKIDENGRIVETEALTTTTTTTHPYYRRGGGLSYGKVDKNGRIVETKAPTTTTTTSTTTTSTTTATLDPDHGRYDGEDDEWE